MESTIPNFGSAITIPAWFAIAFIGLCVLAIAFIILWAKLSLSRLRIAGLITLGLAYIGSPTINFAAEFLGTEARLEGPGIVGGIVATVAIIALASIESSSFRSRLKQNTYKAIEEYALLHSRRSTPEARNAKQKEFQHDPSLDGSILDICTIIDVAFAARDTHDIELKKKAAMKRALDKTNQATMRGKPTPHPSAGKETKQ